MEKSIEDIFSIRQFGLRREARLVQQAHDVAIHLRLEAVAAALDSHLCVAIDLCLCAVAVELHLVARL